MATKLKAIIESLDAVDEKYRDLYIQKRGQWLLQVDGIKTEADVANLQSALIAEREAHVAVKAKYDELTAISDAPTAAKLVPYIEKTVMSRVAKESAEHLKQIYCEFNDIRTLLPEPMRPSYLMPAKADIRRSSCRSSPS